MSADLIHAACEMLRSKNSKRPNSVRNSDELPQNSSLSKLSIGLKFYSFIEFCIWSAPL
jgi:hypothetical protein